ncbi:MAG: hypothetical protein AB7E70_19595 [Hyphomicrobiaceae bacterium]
MIVETAPALVAFAFDHQPGNGTAYRLVVTLSRAGNIRSIAWPEMRWSAGDFGLTVDAHWLRTSGRLKNKADAKAIADIVNHIADVYRQSLIPKEQS